MQEEIQSAEELKFPIVRFDMAEAAADEMRKENANLKADTPKGYRMVRQAKTKVVRYRTSVERTRKEWNAPALVLTRDINAEAKRVTAILEDVEKPLAIMLCEADATREAAIQAKKDALTAEREAREAAERAEREKIEKAERAKREAAHRAKMEEERIKLEAEKEQMKAEAAKQAAELKVQQLAQAALKKKTDAENAKRLASLKWEREQLEMASAEASRKEAAAQKILDAQAEKDRIIAEKKAAAASLAASIERRKEFSKDIEALRVYARAMETVEEPNDLSKQATDLVDECHEKVRDAVEDIWKAIHTHEEVERIEQSVV